MNSFEFATVSSTAAALEQVKAGALFKAGGVDLLDRMKEGLDAPTRVVSLRGVAELDGVREEPAGLSIGPLTTLAALAANAVVKARAPALAQAAQLASTPHIRNVATAGGNLLQRPRCWYFRNLAFRCLRKGGKQCFAQDGEHAYHAIFDNQACAMVHPSDLATALIALGARLEIVGPAGTRKVELGAFFVSPQQDITREHALAPGEILTRIVIPTGLAGARSAYVKQRQRESADWPLASAVAVLSLSAGKVTSPTVVFGAAAPTPWRARILEAELAGKPAAVEAITAAVRAELAKATPLERNGYKVAVFEAVARRAILLAAAPA